MSEQSTPRPDQGATPRDDSAAPDPYRTAALRVVATHRERAFCPWCPSQVTISYDDECREPSKRFPHGARRHTSDVNTDGRCDMYRPSLLTRALRVVGLRSPVLVETEGES